MKKLWSLVRSITGVEWMLLAIILVILGAVVFGHISRERRCDSVLTMARTSSDSIKVMLECKRAPTVVYVR